MDRRTVYASETIREIDALQAQKDAMVGLAWLTQSVYGPNEWVVGLQVAPTNPQGQAVQVQTGQIYQVEETDMTAWSSLLGDATEIVQQGILSNTITFGINPPPLVNESQWYVIEAQFQQLDSNTTILQYFNPINPASPLNGPSGTGAPQNQDRLGAVLVKLKAGLPAPTGDEVKPVVDSGFLALAYIHINFGQATLGTGDITDVRPTYPTIPQILSGGLKTFGITTGLGGNLDASTLGGHPPSDFVLVSNQNLSGVARLIGGDTITGLDLFSAGVEATQYQYVQLASDPAGLPNGSTWFNATDFHLRAQWGNKVVRILTEADMGAGGIVNASTLDGQTAGQIEAQILSEFIPQLSNALTFPNTSAQNVVTGISGSEILTFPFTIKQAVVMVNGFTVPSGGGTISATMSTFSGSSVTVDTVVPAGGSVTYTALAFG